MQAETQERVTAIPADPSLVIVDPRLDLAALVAPVRGWCTAFQRELDNRVSTLAHMRKDALYGNSAREFSKTSRAEWTRATAVKAAEERGFKRVAVIAMMRDMKDANKRLKYISRSLTKPDAPPVLTEDFRDADTIEDFFVHDDGGVFRITKRTPPEQGLQATFEVLNLETQAKLPLEVDAIRGLTSVAFKFANGILCPAGSWTQHGVDTTKYDANHMKQVMGACHFPIAE